MSYARVRALVIVAGLVVFALVFVVITVVRDTQNDPRSAAECPEDYPRADIALREAKDIKINVYNSTDGVGLASSVAANFKNRSFQVLKAGNDPLKKGVDGVAELRFGPKGVGSAHVLRAYFLDQAEPVYDPNRPDDVVDVALGAEFKQLATTTEVNQSLADLQSPELPAGTCSLIVED
ncbi:MAG TPA: LytR C-terminal domain-containing protein [Micromonosporaceae bacterium]|nr:LytR C-terminal domain-containing protein [Micromonosporaceae bacterium]